MTHNNTSPTADAFVVDEGVDSLDLPAEVSPPKQSSTVETTMVLFAVPWAMCTTCLVAVILYVNIHNFAVDGELKTAAEREAVAVAISTTRRDTARYTLLFVSCAIFFLHLGLSYLLFRVAYHTLLSISASLLEFSIMVAMVRKLRCSIFFFVDSIQRAREAEESGRYWVMKFSSFREINSAEAAFNAVSLRMALQQADTGGHTPEIEAGGLTPHTPGGDISSIFPHSILRSLSFSSPSQQFAGTEEVAAHPQSNGGSGNDAISHPLTDPLMSRSGRTRQLSPGLEMPTVPLAASVRSLAASAEFASSARPFNLTLRRRQVALLQISFLSYRQLVQGEAEAVVDITNKFFSAVLLCVRRFNAHIVELFNNSAILSWNGFVESPGDYVQTCAQCGCWLYQHFLPNVKEEESGAFFNLAGYAGYIVCGTTSEHSYVLHGRPVTILRELPSLLEQRYCKYVWLGTSPPPPMQEDFSWVKWGTVHAENNFFLELYAIGAPADDSKWGDMQREQQHVWHAPEWKTFGEESTFMTEIHYTSPGLEETMEEEEKENAKAAERSASTLHLDGDKAAALAEIHGIEPLETFYDCNNILYQLSNTLLGESKSSVVRLALSQNGNLVAVKEIKIERGDMSPMRRRRYQRERRIVVAQGDRPEWMNEVRIMEKLHHTCIVGYISFQETPDRLRIVMEYVGGGNLLQFVTKDAKDVVGRPPMEVLLRSVLEGIDFLHRHGILHGDIKPQNVLVPDSGPCKIADFGISRRISHASTHPIEGTPFYMAPEATRGQATTASDIWSFGIMMAEVLTGRLPYDPDISDTYLIAQFSLGNDVERHLCTPLEPAAHDVFLACTQYDHTKRKTANELLQMPYFKKKAKVSAGDAH